jgi:hypothetical protein
VVDGAEDFIAQFFEGIADFLVGPLEDADAVREGGIGIDHGVGEGRTFEEAEEVFVVWDVVEAVVFWGGFVFDGELDMIEALAEFIGESGDGGGDEVGEGFSGDGVHLRMWIRGCDTKNTPHLGGMKILRGGVRRIIFKSP